MRVEPSGVIFTDICAVQTNRCVARHAAPITAVWAVPGRLQINVCRPCLEEQVRSGEWEIQGARITRRADVAVFSSDRKLQLVVEVKKSSRAKPPLKRWAIEIHRNLQAHAGIPKTPYFLLAILPGSFYLWKESGTSAFDRPPDYEVDANEILKPYFDQLSAPLEVASEFELEAAVSSWLSDVVDAEFANDAALKWLDESGLHAVLKNGSVEMQIPIAA